MNFDKIISNYVEEALKEDKKSCHIALLVRGHKVISHGFNKMDRQCFRGKVITSMHAEIDCLRKCRPIRHTSRYNLVIIKVAKDENLLYHDSSPCTCCTKFIKGLGFKYVYCTTNEGVLKKIKLNEYIPYTKQPSKKRSKHPS